MVKRKKAEAALRKTGAELEQAVEEITFEVEKANEHVEKNVKECMQGYNL